LNGVKLTVAEMSRKTGIKLTRLPWRLKKLIEYDLIINLNEVYQIRDKVIEITSLYLKPHFKSILNLYGFFKEN